jgi:predicted Rossmann fold flavoprotein
MPAATSYDVIILGAGGAGLMAAATAGRRGRSVLVLDHAARIGEKIRISGGGRCNFTNLHTTAANFLSANPHFCKSALRGYTPQDFIALVEKHGIAWHEKTLGQLFCDGSSTQIIDMLLAECAAVGARVQGGTRITAVAKDPSGFSVATDRGDYSCQSLVVATGGLSIPKIGATGFGYDIARQFGLDIVETRPGLVPLTFDPAFIGRLKELAGIAADAEVSCGKTKFAEALLFTHRGLSGPAILQISSYWREGEAIVIDLAPGIETRDWLKAARRDHAKQEVLTVLARLVPRRLAEIIAGLAGVSGRMADQSDARLWAVASRVEDWRVVPQGTEGYRTAEVTLGGVDTGALSSKTMEARAVPGLYFIGEVVDVTGHLGGFNFQWAWSSGVAAGTHA